MSDKVVVIEVKKGEVCDVWVDGADISEALIFDRDFGVITKVSVNKGIPDFALVEL